MQRRRSFSHWYRWASWRLIVATTLGLATTAVFPALYLRKPPSTPGFTFVVPGVRLVLVTHSYGFMSDDFFFQASTSDLRPIDLDIVRMTARSQSQRYPVSWPDRAHEIPRWVPPFDAWPAPAQSARCTGLGWPMRCLLRGPDSLGMMGTPYRPIWTGLLVNTGLLAAAWLIIITLILRLPLRRTIRLRRGHCPMCAYDLLHDLDDGCPECGWNRAVPSASSPPPQYSFPALLLHRPRRQRLGDSTAWWMRS